MKVTVFRIAVVLLIIIFQVSFFDIFFPWPQAPTLLLASVVAWTLVLGFPRSLIMTVPLTIVFDSLMYGTVTWFSLYSVVFAYGASFLSRRLLIEQHGMSLVLYAFFTASGILMYQVITPLLSRVEMLAPFMESIAMAPLASWTILVTSFVLSALLFLLMYFLLKRFEGHIESLLQKQFLNVR